MELRRITHENVRRICRLRVAEAQEAFVASNAESLIEAFSVREDGDIALPFALWENGEPVGFVMFGYGSLTGEDGPSVQAGNYCIWRLMIAKEHQGKGCGRRAMQTALDYLRTLPCGPAEYCWLSYEPENTAARALYRSFGFEENGEYDGDEIVAVRKL